MKMWQELFAMDALENTKETEEGEDVKLELINSEYILKVIFCKVYFDIIVCY